MYVSPKHGANMGMPSHALKECLSVPQSGTVEPGATRGKWRVMHADQRVLVRILLKCRLQSRQLGRPQFACNFALAE